MFFSAFFTTYIPWGSLISALGLFLFYWVCKVFPKTNSVQPTFPLFLPKRRGLWAERSDDRPTGILHSSANSGKFHHQPETEQQFESRASTINCTCHFNIECVAAQLVNQ